MINETVRSEKPKIGRSYGLVALGESGEAGGVVCVTDVIVNRQGSGVVKVIGSEAGESILASAQDAFVYLNHASNWQYKDFDVYVELITPAKGMEKINEGFRAPRPVISGPSAGLAIAVAMLSAFTETAVDPSVLMTGAITASGEVWPVGGLDYHGMGKIEAVLSDLFAKKFLIPKYNYGQLDSQIEKLLLEKKIRLLPVATFVEAASECIIGFSDVQSRFKSFR